jgi:hypothetical protein
MELGASTKARRGSLTMAAISHVFTIARVAKRLGQDEELLADLAMHLDPEDGCLWVMDDTEDRTLAFTELGIENLKELLADLKP